MMTFTALDASNTAHVTLSDPRPNSFNLQAVDTLNDPHAIARAIDDYALRRGIPARMVEVSIVYPPGKALSEDMRGQL